MRAGIERRVMNVDLVGDKGIEEPAPRRILLLVLELSAHGAQFLSQLYSQTHRVIPEHFPRAALHHLRTDVERGEEGIEGRGRCMLHESLVEAPVLHPPSLPFDMAVADMNLRRLRKARQLLV